MRGGLGTFAAMATFISHSPEETEAFGSRLGRLACPGWVFGISGDLGSGKTRFVKGLARGLDIVERVQSPTFALVHEYLEGRLPLAHLDLYRLECPEQILAAGLEGYLFPRHGVSVIEWYDRWTGPCPAALVRIAIRPLDESRRHFDYALPGD